MTKARLFETSGVTGHLLEHEMLGSGHYSEEGEYQPYREAMRYVKEHQPFDPSDPAPRFANDVHATIADMLGLEDYSQLKFFTAVSSLLDKCHGIDGFFELEDADNPHKVLRVTIDITKNPAKGEDYKADIIITVPRDGLDPKDDKEAFSALVNKTAAAITERLKLQGLPQTVAS